MAFQRRVTIGVAARRVGVPAWRLRAWEGAGLIRPERTSKGYRLYSEDDLGLAARLASEHSHDRMALVALEHAADPGNETLTTREPHLNVTESAPQRFAAASTDHYLSQQSEKHAESRPPATRQEEESIIRHLVSGLQRSDDAQEVYSVALECALHVAGTGIGSLSAVDSARQQYSLLASQGLSKRYLEGIEAWRLQEGFAGRAFSQRETIVLGDIQEDRSVTRESVRAEGVRAYACVPLLRGQRRLGILQVYGSRPNSFSVQQIAMLELIAAMVAPSLEIADLQSHVDALQEERARSFREWATQVTASAHQERAEVADQLDDQLLLLREGSADSISIAESIELVISRLRSGRDEQVDLLPLVRSNIIDRLSKLHSVHTNLEVGDWPKSLPSGHVSRLYLVILALAESAAALAQSQLRIRFDSEDGALRVLLADDREMPISGIKSVPVDPNTLMTIKHLGASVQLQPVGPGESVGLLISVPRTTFEVRGDDLTVRERHVLEALRLGASNRGIAAELGISVKTLQNHLTSLYRKLGVASRAQAVEYADQVEVRELSHD
ncbi:MAG: GAF domain-containing protein [Gulosibacter sp.]|uniref:GAF domain-containing protein n=1 Tax=Gulosibacter sp. TaxID=2817531 RepID=UPI003F8EF701